MEVFLRFVNSEGCSCLDWTPIKNENIYQARLRVINYYYPNWLMPARAIAKLYTKDDSYIEQEFKKIYNCNPVGLKRILVISMIYENSSIKCTLML